MSFLIIVGSLLLLGALFLEAVRRRGRVQSVLILGTTALARQLMEEIEARPRLRYAVVGVVDSLQASAEVPFGYPLLGSLENLGKVIEDVRPDRIITALGEQRGRLPVRHLLAARVRGIVVEDGVEVYERLTGKLAIESLSPSNLIFSKDFRRSPLQRAFGRGTSLLLSGIGLTVFSPLLGLISLAIKLDSRGPVFFVQERVGMGGKPFRLIKFRTMHPVNGKTSEWVRDNDDRITRVGRWLRKFRLDELPQFVNILRGDMDLVGPRPHPVTNFDLFVLVLRNAPERAAEIPYYSLRSVVRPGLTGWAQIRYGYANGLEEEIEKMRYDLYYVKNMSFWFDLRILFETVRVVLLGRESTAAESGGSEVSAGLGGKWKLRAKVDQNRAA